MRNTPILIIDDEPAVVESLQEFLEDEGYDVHHAGEGAEALALFASVRPDMVLTDLKMPGMSGLDLIRRIRKVDRSVPIVVITGYGTLDSAIDAIRLDVHDFITKPIDLDHLKDTLDEARQISRATQEIQHGMDLLKEELEVLQSEWKEQLVKLSEAEPLIQTGRLMSAILHNLSNPLSYIMGQTELLQEYHPDMENLDAIRDQALRMKKIISSIGKRIKKSQTRETEWLNLNDLLREEVFFLESHPQFRMEIGTEWDLDPNLPPLKGVAADFIQVFGNILRNAADAMTGRAQKILKLRSWRDEMGVHVSISDNGCGVDSHLKDSIFKPFFSTKTAGAGVVGGLGVGIGLYYCKEIARQYGGEIEARSSSGKGATFILHLPTRRTEIEEIH